MKEIDGWVKIKKYTDNEGNPVCGECNIFGPQCSFVVGDDHGHPVIGPTCPVWHGESKSESCVAEAVSAENERCAKLCESLDYENKVYGIAMAAAIRRNKP